MLDCLTFVDLCAQHLHESFLLGSQFSSRCQIVWWRYVGDAQRGKLDRWILGTLWAR